LAKTNSILTFPSTHKQIVPLGYLLKAEISAPGRENLGVQVFLANDYRPMTNDFPVRILDSHILFRSLHV
jgi:hypothetical protein